MHRPIGREARVASNKRERELARAKHQRQQARRAQEQARRRRITTIIAVIGGLLVVGIAFVWLVRGSNSTSTASATDGATSTASPSPSITGVTCAAAPAVRTTDLSWKTAPALALKPTGISDPVKLAASAGTAVLALTVLWIIAMWLGSRWRQRIKPV